MRDAILAIDQGTAGTRVVAKTGKDGKLLAAADVAHTQHLPRDGWVEHDPREIWRALTTAVAAVLAKVPASRIAGVALANQGETCLTWNRDTGEPLGRAIVWQDARTQPWMDELARDPRVRGVIADKTGLRADSYFSASKLRWLLDDSPDARKLLAAGRLCAGTLDAWLIAELSGRTRFVTDASTAARTLLYDIHRLQWDDELTDIFRIPKSLLPTVLPSAGELAIIDERALPGLGGVPLLASLVDQPAAMIGEGCLERGQIKATFGTGCFIYANSGDDSTPSSHGLLRTIAWLRDGRATYALDGGIFAAGSVLTWLRDGLGLCASEAELDGLAASVDSTGGVICVPALAGLAAPHWRRDARAAFVGMGLATTRAHLVRAALEGIACRVAEVIHAMAPDPRQPLRCDGGLTACTTLMQLTADLVGVPLAISAEPEATVAGAAALAARVAGLCESDAELTRRVRTARTFQPKGSVSWRKARQDRFAEAVAAIRTLDRHPEDSV